MTVTKDGRERTGGDVEGPKKEERNLARKELGKSEKILNPDESSKMIVLCIVLVFRRNG